MMRYVGHIGGLLAIACGALLLLTCDTGQSPAQSDPTAAARPATNAPGQGATIGTPSASTTERGAVAQQPLDSGCVACHTSAKALKAVAAPTPVAVSSAEQAGEG